jgi:peptidylprolyl isomerase
MSRPRRTAQLLATLAAAAILVAACGDEGTPVEDASAAKDKGIPTLSVPVDAAGKKCKAATDVPEAEGKPEVEMPVGELPPEELVKEDITVGDGAEAKAGDSIKVNYVGIACSTGKQFDSSWDNGQPFDAALTEGGLIQGWLDGIPGMKEGGRRKLVIPADLAYGPSGQGDIRPNEALVFVIDLIEVTPASETTTTTAPTETTAPAASSSTTSTTEATTTTDGG